jgi:purine-binding chemotaxis protein CheW
VTQPELGSLDDLVARIDAEVAAAVRAPLDPGAAEGDRGTADSMAEGGAARVATRRHVVFSLSGARCALPIESVGETGHVPGLTRVPNVPSWVAGVANLRGDVLAVIDLRAFLGLEPPERPGAERLVVARSAVLDCRVGFLVDGLHGALAFSSAAIRPPTLPFEARIVPYLRGVVEHEDRLVGLLDLEAIFRNPEMRRLREG